MYGYAVPKYDVNERTVDILYGVMECNEERDKDVTLLIEDMKDQAAQYEAESEFEVPFLSSTQVRLFWVILKIAFVKNLGIYINIWNWNRLRIGVFYVSHTFLLAKFTVA